MGKANGSGFYLRVSTGGQTVENQRQELATAAEQRGWTVVDLYSDNGFSGAKGRDKRPAFDRICKDAVAGKFDIIAAWRVDRLGRSVLHLAQFVEDMRGSGIGLFLLKQGLDSETPTGRAMLGMCACSRSSSAKSSASASIQVSIGPDPRVSDSAAGLSALAD